MIWLALADCPLDAESAEAMRVVLDRDEREHCAASRSLDRLLGRVAAKRAVCEALARAGNDARPTQVTVRRGAGGRPVVLVDGDIRDPLLRRGDTDMPHVIVSISHEHSMGVALAVAQPPGARPPTWVGIDILSKRRMQRRWPSRHRDVMARRVLTPEEGRDQAWHTPLGLGRAIAAKEAAGKAIRWSTGPLSWHDVVLERGAGGLEGAGRMLGDALAARAWHQTGSAGWATARGPRAITGSCVFLDGSEFLVAASVASL